MNLAFPAVLIFVLVLPGITFRYCYRKGFWRFPLTIRPVAEEAASSIIAAVWLHLLWVPVTTSLPGTMRVDFEVFLALLVGDFNDPAVDPIAATAAHPILIALYFLSIHLFAIGAGLLLHFVVRRMKWDVKYQLLRFNNDWHYLLRGEILNFPETNHPGSDVNLVVVSSLVDMPGGAYIFQGFLVDFHFDSAGNLDRLVLRKAHRREIGKDRTGEQPPATPENAGDRWYPISSDFFVLSTRHAKTLNLKYWQIERTVSERVVPIPESGHMA